MHVAGPPPKGVGPECKLAYSAGLQPVPAWDSPVRFEFRTSQGSGGGGFHRKSSDCTVASLNAPDSDRSAPILQNTGTEAVEALGELMNYDRNISPNRNQACASCHMP